MYEQRDDDEEMKLAELSSDLSVQIREENAINYLNERISFLHCMGVRYIMYFTVK